MAVTFFFLVLFFSDVLLAYDRKLKFQQLYKLLNVNCIWYCEGQPTENLQKLQEILSSAIYHGLDPESYKLPNSANPEFATTDMFINLAHHLYYGRVRPSDIYKELNLPHKPYIVPQVLTTLIREGRLEDFFSELAPKNRDYWFLVEQAKFYNDLSAFEWRPIRIAKPLRYGDKSPCLDEIRFRLFLLGDLQEYNPSESFDDALLQGVKNFQRRHGLPENGLIDQKTLAELNVSPKDRLRQIYLNLEKHRWLPEDFKRAVVVNVPSFELFLIEGSIKLHSKVIVGRNYIKDFRPTPMLYSRIESITINPKWYVPVSISTKDILPKVKKNPEYLARKGFRVFLGEEEIDPLQVDWSQYNERNFPFRLVQEPGGRNALGVIKFNFPNPFAVYLHDTPERHLFNHTKRAYSSGCIRVEKARQLAISLLGEGWNDRRLENLIKSGQTQTLRVNPPVPIYILYFTAFERNGMIHFREDLYGYDTILSRALFRTGGRR
ncbi:L,D-transpeptidase family protein [Hydrogenobacter sp. T-2]|uniref:L,D-transpeptidase family protein n=1 Tax=Pampinifervens diazotrophicum TaxID=1632018 RepID=UPI002B25A812|nr:L,D-transpeptidase family protein [Hydrogenobacter sp. T-2]WPM31930.1 L,D-transpeptidase family protein [Hydrogenobacter sp. T-2]